MTYPATDVSTTDMDQGTDVPATARASILDLAQKFNLLRNHISTFMQGLLSTATDAATARAALGAVGTSDNVASATKLATARMINGVNFDGTAAISITDGSKAPLGGAGTSGTWPISITGNAVYAGSAGTASSAANGGVTSVNGLTGAVTVSTGMTSAQVGNATAALGAGAVGTYAFLNTITNGNYGPGAVEAGGNLGWADAYSHVGSAPGGSWRCMGISYSSASGFNATLWLRYA